MTKFIHLRNISSYSLCYGALKIGELVRLAKQAKMPAIALSDKGNLFGLLEFAIEATKQGIQAIPSVSIKVNLPSNHRIEQDEILLIARDQIGYQNLLKIVSFSFLNNKTSGDAATDLAMLSKYQSGLIAIVGYHSGHIAKLSKNNQDDLAIELIQKYQRIFPDNLYLEISRLGYDYERILEKKLLKFALDLNLPLLATNDVRYATKEMYEAQDILHCISENLYFDDPNRVRPSKEHYFKSQSEMSALFSDLPEALENSVNIAKKSLFFPESTSPILPNFSTKEGRDENDELAFQSEIGLKEKLKKIPESEWPRYFDRLIYELSVISKMGFAGYFLIVSDFIKWSKEQKIPVGPGRGSGAGSIVAWSLKITDLDPLKFGLFFERFLNPERISMPDFDIDFCQERREEVITYVRQKYGDTKVAQIITFGKLQAKAVLKDVGRVMQLPYKQVDRICKMIPFNPVNPVTLAQAIEMDSSLKSERDSDPQIAKLLDISLKLEGLNRHASTHAAGIVISNQDLLEIVPLYKEPRSNIQAIQYSMKYTELSGLIKFDFLGLKTLTMIAKTLEILQTEKIEIDIDNLPLDDQKTFDLLSSGNSIGIFQLESAGMRDALKKMKPDKLEDLIALISLYRPGPMENIPRYIACKHGKLKPEYPHPWLEECLRETFGVIIYQEQVMEIAKILASYSLGQADLLRRAMGKKIKSEMDDQRENFVKGSIKNQIDSDKAKEIFELVAKFAGYGFNKAHAAAYALIGYQTAYLKANYKVEFITATLNLDYQDTDKINLFIQEAKKLEIVILPPDINHSKSLFSVEFSESDTSSLKKKSIRYGLAALKSVGINSSEQIVSIREAGLFKNLSDFLQRAGSKNIQKRQLESLIKSGSLSSLEGNRSDLLNNVEAMIRYAQNSEEQQNSKQGFLFEEVTNQDIQLAKVSPLSRKKILQYEYEAIGFYLMEHPLDKFKAILEKENICSSKDLPLIANNKEIILVGAIISYKQRSGKNGRFVTLNISDLYGIADVSIFDERIISDCRDVLYNGSNVMIKASIRNDSNGSRITASKVTALEEFIKTKIQTISLKFESLNEVRILAEEIEKNPGSFPIRLNFDFRKDEQWIKMQNKGMINISEDLYLKLIQAGSDEFE